MNSSSAEDSALPHAGIGDAAHLLTSMRRRAPAMSAWRRDFHANPELGFQEHRTSARIAELMVSWGMEVRTGVGGTGVVGTLPGRRGQSRVIGLRAEMDALPTMEKTGLPHRSIRDGIFHACGHDGHAAILLGTAEYLSQQRDLAGTVRFIFQPAEETLRGSLAMLADGLLTDTPVDEIYALHNLPGRAHGSVGIRRGAILSGADDLRIVVRGVGAHGGQPHQGIDPIVIAAELVGLIQTTVSRSLDALDSGVVTIGTIHGGTASNIIPDEVVLSGTIRSMSVAGRALMQRRVGELCAGLASAFGIEIECEIRSGCPPTINHAGPAAAVERAALRVAGPDHVDADCAPIMASEDFAFLLERCPGAFFFIGQGGPGCHHPAYDFDEANMPLGAAMFVEIARDRLGSVSA